MSQDRTKPDQPAVAAAEIGLPDLDDDLAPVEPGTGPIPIPLPVAGQELGCWQPSAEQLARSGGDVEAGVPDLRERVSEDAGRDPCAAEDELGTQLLRVQTDAEGHLVEVADDRGPHYFPRDHVEHMGSVLRAVVRGQAGVLAGSAAEQRGANRLSSVTNLAVGSPLCHELLREGDGAAEVMLASAATASYMMLGRVGESLNVAVTAQRSPFLPNESRDLSRTFANLSKALASGLSALANVRSARRNWDVELQVRRVQSSREEVVRVEHRRH